MFALTSRRESLPRVQPQAMTAGLPSVATAVDGNAEAVEDGTTGLPVAPGEPEAMTDVLVRRLDDPELRARMGAAGQARAAESQLCFRATD